METALLVIMNISLVFLLLVVATPVVFALTALFSRSSANDLGEVQKVSVILPLFNEESCIQVKMDNVRLALDHCTKPYEVVMGSDGSTDNTVEVVERYIREYHLQNWRILSFENEGKGRTISKLVAAAKGDLIVSTDADVGMDQHAIALAVSQFEKDDRLGCLSSIPTFELEKMKSQSLYWKTEMMIRNAQSRMGQLIVVTGWLYAFRKDLYRDIPQTAMADDLWVPLTILLQGYRVAHHPDFKAYSEKTNEDTEITRRKRVISGGADIVKRLFGQLVFRPGLLGIVFLHKINRWLLPLWLFLFVTASIVYRPIVFWAYLGLLVVLASVLSPKRLWQLVRSVCSPIFAALHMGKRKDLSKWEHTRIS